MSLQQQQQLQGILNTSNQLASNQQAQQLRQLHGILSMFFGNQGQGTGANSGATAGILNSATKNKPQQTLLAARNQAVADTTGLNAAAVRDFQTSILPQLQAGAEGAGASANALTALLTQKAAIDSAGNVAKLQGNQITNQEQVANQANANDNALTIAQGHDQTQLISGILSSLLQQFAPPAFTGGGNSGGGNSFTPPIAFQGNPMDTPMLGGGFVGPSSNANTGYRRGPAQ